MSGKGCMIAGGCMAMNAEECAATNCTATKGPVLSFQPQALDAEVGEADE